MNVVEAYAHHMASEEREAVRLGLPSVMEQTDATWEDAAGRLPGHARYGEPMVERVVLEQGLTLACPRCARRCSIVVLNQWPRDEQEMFCDGMGCSYGCRVEPPSTSAAQFGDFAIMAYETLIGPPSRNGTS